MSPQLVTILLSALGGGVAFATLVWIHQMLQKRDVEPIAPASEPAQTPVDERPVDERPVDETPVDETPSADDPEARANLLLATMSHEIRTPLNGVLGMLQLLDGTDMSREQRRIVRTILDSGQILSQVVDDYLAYYRLESEQGVVASPGVCELEEVVHQTMMLFQGLAYEKGLEFVLLTDARAPHVVRTDALRLRQILSNLVLNAIKYTDEGEVTVSIEQVSGQTEIAVSDTGPGMSEEDVAKLFEPFFRAEASAATEKGSGLGLVIARRLVEVLGGELDVDSEPGVGTTFTLRFDFEVLLPAPPDPPEFPWESALVVAGRPSASMALAEILRRFGLQVSVVDAAGARSAKPADLVFVFSGRSTSRGNAAQPGPPGSIVQPGAVRVDVLWLSDPRAHLRDAEGHVLIEPFCRATVHHALSELASGARRTSTIDRWRHSMADALPLSILVAEDDVVSAQVIAGMLANLGYTPTIVTNGPEAVEAIGRQTFDVALLDLNLPGFGGIEIMERVATEETWCIAMSASVQPELRRRCREAGFRDFLPKPLAAGGLQSALVHGARRESGVIDRPETSGPDEKTQPSMEPASGAIRRMRELFARSPAAYRDLLKSHIDQTDLLCADLEKSLSGQGDMETARRATHTLQAAAASFGCDKVAAHAGTIEAEWDALTPERRHTLTRRLLDAWRNEERADVVRELEALSTEG